MCGRMDGGFTGDSGKVVEELLQILAAFKIVQRGLERDTSAAKYWRAAKYLWISNDHAVSLHLVLPRS